VLRGKEIFVAFVPSPILSLYKALVFDNKIRRAANKQQGLRSRWETGGNGRPGFGHSVGISCLHYNSLILLLSKVSNSLNGRLNAMTGYTTET
jgi:hypothetical protein